jgi:hypothetical protein
MGLWVATPVVDAGEILKRGRAANRDQNGRAVGGRLFVTDKRLLFQPSRIDLILGGKAWTCDLSEIAAVGASPRDGRPFSGGTRTRLRVETKDGDVDRFVVNHLSEVIDELRTTTGVDGGEVTRFDDPPFRAAGPWIRTGLLFAGVIVLILLDIFVLH